MITNLVAFVLALVVVFGYLLPAWIAVLTKHPNTPALGFINVFLGWTVVGWIACLVWSVYALKVKCVVNLEVARNVKAAD